MIKIFEGMTAIDIAAMLTNDGELLREFSNISEFKANFTELDLGGQQQIISYAETRSRKFAEALRRISRKAR